MTSLWPCCDLKHYLMLDELMVPDVKRGDVTFGDQEVRLGWVGLKLFFWGPLKLSGIMVDHRQICKLVILNWSSYSASLVPCVERSSSDTRIKQDRYGPVSRLL